MGMTSESEISNEKSNESQIDLINRWEAIDYIESEYRQWGDEYGITDVLKDLEDMPSAQPERLTDDDFETIRIHLNAYKEKLCNQRRWEEAEEYQRIIDRFMAFASAQQDIIHCGDCKYYHDSDGCFFSTATTGADGFCHWAERKEGEADG